MREHAHLGQHAHLEAAHVEEQVGVVLRVDGDEALFPIDGGHRARQPVLQVPEDRAPEVDVVLHQAHTRVAWPTLAVIVPDHVLIVRVGVLGQVALDQVLTLLRRQPQQQVQLVDVAAVETDRVALLRRHVAKSEKLIGHGGWPRDLGGAREPEDQEIEHQPVVLHDEGRELQPAQQPVRVGVVHVLEGDVDIVLGGHVVGEVVVDDEAQQPIKQRQVDLLVHLGELRLDAHDAVALGRVPHVLEVVDAQAPLVDEQWRRLCVGRLDPVGQQVALVRLVPEVLIEVRIGDLLERLDLDHGDQV